jgi:hypothetical protein
MFSMYVLNTGIRIPPTYAQNNRLHGGMHSWTAPDSLPVLQAQARYQIQAKEIELTLSNEIIMFMLARLKVNCIQGHIKQ